MLCTRSLLSATAPFKDEFMEVKKEHKNNWIKGYYGIQGFNLCCVGNYDGAYRRSVELVVEYDCYSIGFSLLSAGVVGFQRIRQGW